MGDSKKDTNNKQGNSAVSDNNGNQDKHQSDDLNIAEISDIKDLDGHEHEKPSNNEKISEDKALKNPENSSKQQSSKNSSEKENNSDKAASFQKHTENEDNQYHFPVTLEHDFVELIKTNRDKIIKGSALVVGGFLILYGLVLVSTSVTKVADNVIFGEDATADAFLMLLGVLIIVAAFAQSIMEKTSLNKIRSELEDNDQSSESKDDSKKVKENDNKVSDDNKDNIVGKNKR